MKRWMNVTVQLAGVLAHMGNIATPLFRGDEKVIVSALVAGLQGVAAVIAHNYNPDGTSAKVAWEPRK